MSTDPPDDPIADEQEDDLCPHGWPLEFCGICHEADDEASDTEQER